ncbi:MAG: IS481 family transposase [Candidatus Scalindua sp.]|jgi:transposase InsO family protein|nr:IS481 family transposase [Candidatus Scalindua sp.]
MCIIEVNPVKKEIKEYLRFREKIIVLEYARKFDGPIATCREFNIPKSTFYEWKKKFDTEGIAGLRYKKKTSKPHPRKTPDKIINKILELRKCYQLGPERISMYLERFHDLKVSESTVYRILAKHGISRLSKSVSRRSIHSKRYNKTVPGHHIQVDVKFVNLKDAAGKKVRRYQYTAIDDATRVRALKILKKHNQNAAIEFIDYIVEKFPFRIHTIRTDRGHEFQARFHWYVEDKGMCHVYIKPRSPQLNGKVERSHRTDQEEFYQLLTYTDDVDLNRKLEAWEEFYNYHRPHSGIDGNTPYEKLRSILN